MLTRLLTDIATGISSMGVTQGPGAHKTTTEHAAVMSSLSPK